METQLVDALNRQGNQERLAAAHYEAIAYWCESEDYTGLAKLYFDQAGEERKHAAKIFKHLLDRGFRPRLTGIDTPVGEFESPLEVAKAALKLEEENTAGITACYELALELRDYPSQLLLQWFINEQVEEEASANRLVVLTRRAGCSGAMLSVDRHVHKLIGEDEAEELVPAHT